LPGVRVKQNPQLCSTDLKLNTAKLLTTRDFALGRRSLSWPGHKRKSKGRREGHSVMKVCLKDFRWWTFSMLRAFP